MPLNITE